MFHILRKNVFQFIALTWFVCIYFLYVYYKFDLTNTLLLLILLISLVFVFLILRKFLHNTRLFERNISFSISVGWIIIGIALITYLVIIVSLLWQLRKSEINLLAITFFPLRHLIFVFGGYSLFTLSYFAIGKTILDRLSYTIKSRMGKFLFSQAIGIGISMLYFYVAAILHLLMVPALVLYFIMAGAVSRKYLFKNVKNFLRYPVRLIVSFDFRSYIVQRTWLSLFILITLLIGFLGISIYFPTSFDDARSYYNVPATYVENGGIVSFPFENWNNGNMAYAFIYSPYILFSSTIISYSGLYFFILSLIALFYITKKYFSADSAPFATFLYFIMPWNLNYIHQVKVEFIIVFFVILSFASLSRHFEFQNRRWIILTGTFLGIIAAIKYVALIVLPAFLIMVLVDSMQREKGLLRALADCIVLSIGAMLSFAPWGLFNLIYYGNLLYPYVVNGKRFAYNYIFEISREARFFLYQFHQPIYDAAHGVSRGQFFGLNLWNIGLSRSIYESNHIGPQFLATMGFILLSLKTLWTRLEIRRLAVFILVVIVMWYYVTNYQLWYMMYVFPLLGVIIAISILKLKNTMIVMLVSLLLICNLFITLDTNRLFFVQYMPGLKTQDEFSKLFGAHYSLANYLNETVAVAHPDYLVFPMGDIRSSLIRENFRHLYANNYEFIAWIGLVIDEKTNEAIRDRMRSMGITHIYYVNEDIENYRRTWCEDESQQACSHMRMILERFDSFSSLLRIAEQTNEWTIYEL